MTYLAASFGWPFSGDHLRVIGKLQRALLVGGLFVEAVFRGWGKTTVAAGAALWAALYGHRKFLAVITKDGPRAKKLVESILFELENNDLLAEDFPEVCYLFRSLEGKSQRAAAQMYAGRRTHIERRRDSVVFPFVNGSAAAGVVIRGYGMGAGVRGMQHKRGDGVTVRPDFVLLDDPQKDSDAKSKTKTDNSEDLILGGLLGLSGHDKRIAAVMTCTVMEPNDLAERFLDNERHPEWQAERLGMVKKWSAAHETLWLGEYADILRDPNRTEEQREKDSKEFYAEHREAMDAGCEVAWTDCYERETEASAIQHAYNLRIRLGEKIFFAEYMNVPLRAELTAEPALEPADIIRKVNNQPRYTPPEGSSLIVAHIDLGTSSRIHWTVTAWGDYLTGAVIDYGRVAVERLREDGGVEAEVREKVEGIAERLLTTVYRTESGDELTCSEVGIDAGWMTQEVYTLIRQSPYRSQLVPMMGQGGEKQIYVKKGVPRRNYGEGWVYAMTRKRTAKLLVYDSDQFKTTVGERWRTKPGARGCLMVFGTKGQEHWDFAEHQCSELSWMKNRSDGVEFVKWEKKPGQQDHWKDNVVGCAVLAAKNGITAGEKKPKQRPKPPPRRQPQQDVSGGVRYRYR
jgi:hypothetical protein